MTTTHYGTRPDGAGDCLHDGPQWACAAPGCANAKTTEPIRVLTVQQPHADCIAYRMKGTENRSRLTWYRGVLWIHAGLEADRQAVLDGIKPGPDKRGFIIATSRLVGCHQGRNGVHGSFCCPEWGHSHAWHWELDDVQALTAPVRATGALGMWRPTNAVVRSVRAQQKENRVQHR